MVDKFVGDEAIGLFFAASAGTSTRPPPSGRRAPLLDAVGRADATQSGPIPVGAAVHTGTRSSARRAREER